MAENESQPGTSGDEGMPPWTAPVEDGADAAGGRGLLARLGAERRLLLGGLAGLVLLLFVALLVYLYLHRRDEAPPIEVAAPGTAHREAPVEPGGMEVPDRDRLVFRRLKGEDVEEPERLAKGAETPAPEAVASDGASTPAAPAVPSASPPARKARSSSDDGANAGKGVPQKAAGPAEPAARPAVSAEPAAASAPAENGGLRGPWNVQIAAFQMRHRAESFVASLPFDHPDLFKGLRSAIVPAERNGMHFWRVRYGPFPDRRSADAKCRAVRAAKLNCIVVRVP